MKQNLEIVDGDSCFRLFFYLAFVLSWNPNILIRLPWNNTPLESLVIIMFLHGFSIVVMQVQLVLIYVGSNDGFKTVGD